MRPRLERSVGREFFGSDPATYDAVRPGHPDEVYDTLRDRCALGPGSTVLEMGPGTGHATRRLLELGASPLVALEPDPSLAAYVRAAFGDQVEVRVTTLEDAELEADAYDVAVAASAFHWVEEDVGLSKLHAALRPRGSVAVWWTSYGARPDAFSLALDPLFEDLPHGFSGPQGDGPPFARDAKRRLEALATAGFDEPAHHEFRWSREWDTQGIRGLYSTFSPISVLEPERRKEFLDTVARIAEDDFGGRVEKLLVTSLYTARKPS